MSLAVYPRAVSPCGEPGGEPRLPLPYPANPDAAHPAQWEGPAPDALGLGGAASHGDPRTLKVMETDASGLARLRVPFNECRLSLGWDATGASRRRVR